MASNDDDQWRQELRELARAGATLDWEKARAAAAALGWSESLTKASGLAWALTLCGAIAHLCGFVASWFFSLTLPWVILDSWGWVLGALLASQMGRIDTLAALDVQAPPKAMRWSIVGMASLGGAWRGRGAPHPIEEAWPRALDATLPGLAWLVLACGSAWLLAKALEGPALAELARQGKAWGKAIGALGGRLHWSRLAWDEKGCVWGASAERRLCQAMCAGADKWEKGPALWLASRPWVKKPHCAIERWDAEALEDFCRQAMPEAFEAAKQRRELAMELGAAAPRAFKRSGAL